MTSNTLSRLLLAALAVASLASARAPATSEEASGFAEAADAYRRADYDRAAALWEGLLEGELSDLDRARVCYDLGNVEWRRGHPHQAIGWYTACLRLDPRNADAWANLEFARREAGLDPADRGDLRSTVRRLLTMWRPEERRWLVLGGVFLLAFALGVETWRGGRGWRRLVFGALGLAVLLALPWLRGLIFTEEDPMLVIRSSSVSLRSEPDLGRPSTAVVEPATVVQRIDALPDWVRVRTPDGEKGWLQSEAVFALER